MPTYEYECSKCGGHFDEFQSMKDAPLTVCNLCGAKGKVKRLIGAGAGMIFKGSGFYITDYKNSGAKSASGGGESKSGESKSESKPAETKSSGGGCSGGGCGCH